MIQALLVFALGLLAAGLLALVVAPLIWRRAVRLTRARVEASGPMTRAEIQAEKDQLRAGFAVSTRRLEIDVERLTTRTGEQTVEIDRKREEIAKLAKDRTARIAAIAGLEGRVAGLTEALSGTEEKLAGTRLELAARDRELAERALTLQAFREQLAGVQQLNEEQRLELIARDTEIGNLGDEVSTSRAAAANAGVERDELAVTLAAEQARLASERRRADDLVSRVGALEAERAERLAEIGDLRGAMKVLEAEITADRGRRDALAQEVVRLEAERASQRAAFGSQAEELARLVAELADEARKRVALEARIAAGDAALQTARNEVSALTLRFASRASAESENIRRAVAAGEADKEVLVARLKSLEGEYAVLRAENAELRRVTGAEWEKERLDNQGLRQRLGEIAADVIRMTQNIGTRGATAAPVPAEESNGATELRRPIPFPRPAATMPRAPGDAAEAAVASTAKPADTRSLGERLRSLQHTGAGTQH